MVERRRLNRTRNHARISLRDALDDDRLLGHVISGPSWRTWRILLIAAMGEPLTDAEREVFTRITGRAHEPGQRVSELEVIAGRRGGKTRALACLASYLSGLCDNRDVLAPGETGVCLCLAQDQRVATKILDFCEQDFKQSDILRQLVVRRTADTLELGNNINIEVRPASFRKLRGPTYIAILADELAFWFIEDTYSNPDVEVLAAARPGLLTTRGPTIMASSPYAKKGVLFDTWKRHYGPNGSPAILVAKGTTRDFNPTVRQEEIDAELEKDRARNTAEYLAEFRNDLEAFVSLEVVESCVSRGVIERAPQRNIVYSGFVDPSGGSVDSFTLAIAHREIGRQTIVVDAIRDTRPPLSPEAVVEDYARVLKSYRINKVVGDRYGSLWPVEQFSKFGVRYEQSARPKSELYQDTLALLNSRRIDLLDNPRLVQQFVGLERRVARSGKDSIDHFPGGHDDLCNAAAGAAATINMRPTYNLKVFSDGDDDDDPDGARAFRVQRFMAHIMRYG